MGKVNKYIINFNYNLIFRSSRVSLSTDHQEFHHLKTIQNIYIFILSQDDSQCDCRTACNLIKAANRFCFDTTFSWYYFIELSSIFTGNYLLPSFYPYLQLASSFINFLPIPLSRPYWNYPIPPYIICPSFVIKENDHIEYLLSCSNGTIPGKCQTCLICRTRRWSTNPAKSERRTWRRSKSLLLFRSSSRYNDYKSWKSEHLEHDGQYGGVEDGYS